MCLIRRCEPERLLAKVIDKASKTEGFLEAWDRAAAAYDEEMHTANSTASRLQQEISAGNRRWVAWCFLRSCLLSVLCYVNEGRETYN